MELVDIRTRRRKLGLTQIELGEKLGIPGNTISRWELGTVTPEHPKLIDLALKALEYETGYPVPRESDDDFFSRNMSALAELKERQEARATRIPQPAD